MADEETKSEYDNAIAVKIVDVAEKGADGRKKAEKYIFQHDITRAVAEALKIIGAVDDSLKVTVDYDADDTDTGSVLGFKFYPSAQEVKVRYKTRHGARWKKVRELSDEQIGQAAQMIDRSDIHTATLDEIESKTEAARNAGDWVPE